MVVPRDDVEVSVLVAPAAVLVRVTVTSPRSPGISTAGFTWLEEMITMGLAAWAGVRETSARRSRIATPECHIPLRAQGLWEAVRAMISTIVTGWPVFILMRDQNRAGREECPRADGEPAWGTRRTFVPVTGGGYFRISI